MVVHTNIPGDSRKMSFEGKDISLESWAVRTALAHTVWFKGSISSQGGEVGSDHTGFVREVAWSK